MLGNTDVGKLLRRANMRERLPITMSVVFHGRYVGGLRMTEARRRRSTLRCTSCLTVDQAPLSKIRDEPMLLEEIRSKDGLWYGCDDELNG